MARSRCFGLTGPDTEARIGELIEAVTAVRNIRSELGIAPGTPVMVRIAADGQGDRVRAIEGLMKTLAKVSDVELLGTERPSPELGSLPRLTAAAAAR